MTKPRKADVVVTADEASDERMQGKIAVVIDVLRCTSVMVTALACGAEAVIPFVHVEQARAYEQSQDSGTVLLGGERDGRKIKGFHLDNSPYSYTESTVRDRTILMTTTNGTRAIEACKKASKTLIGSFLNAKAVAEALCESTLDPVMVCAGTNGRYSMDDALCAGMILSLAADCMCLDMTDMALHVRRLYEISKHDLPEALSDCFHVRVLRSLGFGRDVDACMLTDRYEIVPVYKKGRVFLPQKEEASLE